MTPKPTLREEINYILGTNAIFADTSSVKAIRESCKILTDKVMHAFLSRIEEAKPEKIPCPDHPLDIDHNELCDYCIVSDIKNEIIDTYEEKLKEGLEK